MPRQSGDCLLAGNLLPAMVRATIRVRVRKHAKISEFRNDFNDTVAVLSDEPKKSRNFPCPGMDQAAQS
jgi:hypothetical protein